MWGRRGSRSNWARCITGVGGLRVLQLIQGLSIWEPDESIFQTNLRVDLGMGGPDLLGYSPQRLLLSEIN